MYNHTVSEFIVCKHLCMVTSCSMCLLYTITLCVNIYIYIPGLYSLDVVGVCLIAPCNHFSQSFAEVKIRSDDNETLHRSTQQLSIPEGSCEQGQRVEGWRWVKKYSIICKVVKTYIMIFNHLFNKIHSICQRDPNASFGPI